MKFKITHLYNDVIYQTNCATSKPRTFTAALCLNKALCNNTPYTNTDEGQVALNLDPKLPVDCLQLSNINLYIT